MVVRVKVGVGSSLGLYGKGGWWLESRLRLGLSLSLWEGWVVVRVKVGVGSSLGLWEGWVGVRVKVEVRFIFKSMGGVGGG